ncbi:MAG: APC family permease [Deltaproteobacteria bacterium]|nr:APC family permease [Deltaproteobacteria bacterium]
MGEFWRLLIGNPLETELEKSEKLSKRRGLAVLSSDALSSTAYATEEMLRVLMLCGAIGLAYTFSISIVIVALIAIVGFSYYRTIHAYPGGGGAYIVAHENLGETPGLIAAASLLVDYSLTVAVSICAGTAAITSAFPELATHAVALAVGFVMLVTILNLRGLRESSTIFAIPTYLFIFVYGGMIAYGIYRIASGELPRQVPSPEQFGQDLRPLTVFLLLRAFASGSSALTGIEAVSNGVPAFHPPQAKNAVKVLMAMVIILGIYFLGTSYIAAWLGVVPNNHETVVSQIARELFQNSALYYIVQFVTMTILILAANTAYTGFPRLSSILARDKFLPRQLANLGDRLVYSNGIIFLGIFVSVLIIIYHADTHSLVPLYMVGVFITFTLSQMGMVRFWLRKKSKNWWMHLVINGFGAICTAVVGVVVFWVKFEEGAWITFVLITLLIIAMKMIHKHYEEFSRQICLDYAKPPKPFLKHKVVIPVSDVHRGVLEAARYARTLGTDVTALYVDLGNKDRMENLKRDWAKWVPDVPIQVLPSPYRSVIRPIVHYLDELRDQEGPDTVVTVVIPEFVPLKWWHHLLHNQTAWMLKIALLFNRKMNRRYKVLADVPYYLRR